MPLIYSPRLSSGRCYGPDRSQLLFLVVRQKYSRNGHRIWDSNEEHALSGPLKSAGIARVFEYYCDTDSSGGIFNDHKFIQLVARTRPDLLVLSGYDPNDPAAPSMKVLATVRDKADTPILAMWPDSTGAGSHRLSTRMADIADLNVMWDSAEMADRFPEKNNYLRLWAPLDFSIFHPRNCPRDIPVSFVGSIGSFRSVREEYLDYLSQQNVGLVVCGGRENPLELKEYADIASRSKIALNFSHSIGNTHQLKHRVFETMFSATLLLENRNSETRQFFEPMVDYVDFESKEDMADKVRYFLEHDDERLAIAMNGYRKATEQYNYRTFWDQIMHKLFDLGIFTSSRIPTCSQEESSA